MDHGLCGHGNRYPIRYTSRVETLSLTSGGQILIIITSYMTLQHHRPSLPIELLQEIVLYLPRHILRSLLLFQPHPLGRIASFIYFSSLTLHFGVNGNHLWHPFSSHSPEDDVVKKVLEERHEKRSHEILEAMINGAHFANSVQTLKIYAPGSNQLTLQMGSWLHVLHPLCWFSL